MKINNKTIKEPLINDEIKGYKLVRLIYEDNNKENNLSFNILTTLEIAKSKASEMKLDLVEINGNANPPILKIIDYSKYLFNLKKNLKNKKKTSQIKEIQLKTNISEHDIDTKVKQAKKFIADGDKVKVTLTMKGRELTRREDSKKCIFVFIDKMSDVAIPESMPKDDNNKSIVILKTKNKS